MHDQPSTVPRLPGFDHSLALLREGYGFISSRCDRLGTDMFRTRIMLRPVTCLRGQAAAEMVYCGTHFTRNGAMPATVLRLLQDKGSVQALDDAAHHHRKALFVDLLMSDAAEAGFLQLFTEEWRQAMGDWATRPSIMLFDEANLVLTRAICRWMGVPLDPGRDVRLCRELSAMIESTASVGPRVLGALALRRRAERFIVGLVRKLRAEPYGAAPHIPLARIALFRGSDGKLLPDEVAAVEVLNILRPTVAIGRFIMFAALALAQHPHWPQALHGAGTEAYERFAEEVRRLYPFFPAIGGIAREAFAWRGHRFEKGDWVLLDLYGTNHDPRRFPHPASFAPGQAPSWRAADYGFVPQGAGPVRQSHKCPGERLTVATLREATRLLVEEMDYELPLQDLSVPLHRLPARTKDGMILANVRRVV